MSNIKNKITITIVTFHSDHLIFKRLDNLKEFKTIIVENSLKKKLKNKIEEKVKKILVMDLEIIYHFSKAVLIMNPDAFLTKKISIMGSKFPIISPP